MDWQDRLEIAELLNRYLLAVDSHAPAPWLALFTDDGVFENAPDCAEGQDALAAFITGWHASGITAPIRHFMGSYAIDPDGDGATATTYYWAADVVDWPRVVATGRFVDRLRRTTDGWRLAERRHLLDPTVGRPDASP